MKVLGVTDHRFLGGFGTYRDSGMKWHEDGHAIAADDVHDNAFWHADLTEAADHLVEVIREVRPQVLVTYDQFGGYGHPDHIQAHRVAMYAAQLAAVPSYRRDLGEPWDIAKIYWAAMSETGCATSLRALREAGDTATFEGMDPDGPLPPFVTPDELISAARRRRRPRRAQDGRARRAPHPGQPDGPFFARRRERPRVVGRGVLPDRQGHRRRRSATTGSRPTSSPACDVTAGRCAAGAAAAVVGAVSGAGRRRCVHQRWWGLALALGRGARRARWLPAAAGCAARRSRSAGSCRSLRRRAATRPEGDYLDRRRRGRATSFLAGSLVLAGRRAGDASRARRARAPTIRDVRGRPT